MRADKLARLDATRRRDVACERASLRLLRNSTSTMCNKTISHIIDIACCVHS